MGGFEGLNNFGGNNPPRVNAGISWGSGGFKANINFGYVHNVGDWSGEYGLGLTYHSNFYKTGRSGVELRNSFKLNYDDGNTGVSLGTNFWNGTGGMSEFKQRTGILAVRSGDFNFAYENDGTPFQLIGFKKYTLGDGGDSYRTAALRIGVGDFFAKLNLLTGERNHDSYKQEERLPGGKMGIPQGKGQYGETYTHGFVHEQGDRHRYGGLTLNYQGASVGLNSEWFRHGVQNIFAHDWANDQRQFEMLSDDYKPVLNFSNQEDSNFTLWGK